MMQRAYARLHQVAFATDKRVRQGECRTLQGLTNDDEVGVQSTTCAKQMKICDAERTIFSTPMFIHLTQPYGFACHPLRDLVTSRQRRIINCLQTDGQTSLTAVFRPSMIFLTVRIVCIGFSNRQKSTKFSNFPACRENPQKISHFMRFHAYQK